MGSQQSYHPHQLRDEFRFVGQDAEIFSGRSDNLCGRGRRRDQQFSKRWASGCRYFMSRDVPGSTPGRRTRLAPVALWTAPCGSRVRVSPSNCWSGRADGAMDTRPNFILSNG